MPLYHILDVIVQSWQAHLDSEQLILCDSCYLQRSPIMLEGTVNHVDHVNAGPRLNVHTMSIAACNACVTRTEGM